MNRSVASFPQNKDEEVRVSIQELKGQNWLDIRVYAALPDTPQEKVPTGKGLLLRVSDFLPLKKALAEAENALKENRLIHE
ncbi:MAG: hypothetical protein HYZ52_02155 [Candidatus Omnitrophica bacterium]|nr:hypothetical protein [Candidatus Omnitrophota bacterium]